MSSGKKGKKTKGKAVSLKEFLGDTTNAGGSSIVVTPKVSNWADESEEYEADPDRYHSAERIVLPTAPRTARGPDVDPSRIPTEPPFTAYIANLPFEVDDCDIERFFQGLNVKSIRLPREGGENGRFKGFGYVEFETRQELVDALSKHEDVMRNRNIRVDIAEAESGDRGGRRGGSMGGGGMRDEERSDRSGGVNNWRAGPREAMPARDDRNGPSYRSDRSPGRSGRFEDRERRGGFGDRDRDQDRFGDRDRGDRFGDRDRGDRFGDRDRGFGDRDRGFGDRDRGYGDRDRDRFGDRDRGGFGDRDRGDRYGDRDRGDRYGDRDRGDRYGDRDRGDRFGDRDRGDRFGDRDRGDRFGDRGRDRYDDRDRGGRYGGRYDDDRRGGSGWRDGREGGRDGPRDGGRDSRDDEDRWRRGGGGGGGGGGVGGSSDDGRDDQPRERRKLNLQPRSVPIEEGKDSTGTSSSIFGSARPVDTARKELEIEEKLKKHEPPKRETRGGGGGNIFGNARPVDTAAREREIEEKLKKQDGGGKKDERREAPRKEERRADGSNVRRVPGSRDDDDDDRYGDSSSRRDDDQQYSEEDYIGGSRQGLPLKEKDPILDTTNKFTSLGLDEEEA